MRVQQIFRAVSPLPLVLFTVALWGSSRLEAWGAWAVTASVAPILIGFSTAMGVVGVMLWVAERRHGNQSFGLLVATVLAALPCLGFLARIAYMEFMRGF